MLSTNQKKGRGLGEEQCCQLTRRRGGVWGRKSAANYSRNLAKKSA